MEELENINEAKSDDNARRKTIVNLAAEMAKKPKSRR